MADDPDDGGWSAVVDDLARVDRRTERAVTARLRDAARELDGDWCRTHPLTRRRVAGTAARDALAVYLLAGGTWEHLRSLVHLLGVVGDGYPTNGSLADRAAVARRLVDAVDTPDVDRARVVDCELAAAALEHAGPHVPRPVAPADERPVADRGATDADRRADREHLAAAYLHPDGPLHA